jgi:uncharacterized protein YutE (UPF0331/DUF86 family)
MTINRENLAQYLDEIANLEEAIREEFLSSTNPGVLAVFRELQMAVRCLKDAENLLDRLVVKG